VVTSLDSVLKEIINKVNMKDEMIGKIEWKEILEWKEGKEEIEEKEEIEAKDHKGLKE